MNADPQPSPQHYRYGSEYTWLNSDAGGEEGLAGGDGDGCRGEGGH